MVDLIDTNGVKPTLKKGVLGYDDYSAGGDAGRLYVGTGTESIAQAKKSEVDAKIPLVASTNNAIVRFDGTTGKVKNSGVIIDDNNNVGVGTSTPSRKLEVQSYGVGAAGILRISGLAGSGTTTNASLLELSITGAGGGIVTQNLIARYNNGYEIATYFTDRVSWRDNATNTQLFAIDSSGNALVTNSTGVLGYGTGAGGTVTQLTSKGTSVTLNKPCGMITMNNAALAAGAVASFNVTNSTVTAYDNVDITFYGNVSSVQEKYSIEKSTYAGGFSVTLKNLTAGSLSEAVTFNFTIIKGVAA